MADKTGIEWTRGADGSPGATWNPITGCSVVSPGCTNCYAMRLAGTRLQHHPTRSGLTQPSKAGPVWNGEVRLNQAALDQPLRWKRPRKIFVCAHGDLFHENVPDDWIVQVFAVMALAPQHTYQVLTKRADRMRNFVSVHIVGGQLGYIEGRAKRMLRERSKDPGKPVMVGRTLAGTWPWPHVWLGVSVEDQKRAEERIPHLLATPAAVRFVSAEPLLGSVDLTEWLHGEPRLNWVIVGGESGPGARPMHPDWARSLRYQCVEAGVPYFFKQFGRWGIEDPGLKSAPHVMTNDGTLYTASSMAYPDGLRRGEFIREGHDKARPHMIYPVGKKAAGRLLDGREWNEMPASGAAG